MSNYGLLNRKNIIEILDGDVEVIKKDEYKGSMPYLSGPTLVQMCNDFGMDTSYGSQSRWVYLQDLMTHMETHNRSDELLQYIFSLERFTGLASLESPEEIESAYREIVEAVINKINGILCLGHHELQMLNGHFYVTESDKKPVVENVVFKAIDLPYVHGLADRCEDDFQAGNYDSVVTKSRTVVEEVLVYILEKNEIEVTTKGDLLKLYGQIKQLFNMSQNKNFDGRINSMLSGIEKIIQSLAEMRNMNSDAHGVGSKRINIRECEARLIMNSAMTYCEYILAIHKEHQNRINRF